MLVDVFRDGLERYGPREWSPNIIRRYEEATGLDVRAAGFPAEMIDDEPEEPGHEVTPGIGAVPDQAALGQPLATFEADR